MITVIVRDEDTDEVIFDAVSEFVHLEQGEEGIVIRIRREQSDRQPPSKPPVVGTGLLDDDNRPVITQIMWAILRPVRVLRSLLAR